MSIGKNEQNLHNAGGRDDSQFQSRGENLGYGVYTKTTRMAGGKSNVQHFSPKENMAAQKKKTNGSTCNSHPYSKHQPDRLESQLRTLG